jgi:probable addiction module antidote protein
MVHSDFRKYHLERLKDNKEAIMYLEIAIQEFEQDGDTQAFLMALRDVAEAQGGMTQLSNKTKLSRTSLYKALSSHGNPKIDTISNILKGLGFRIKLEPYKVSRKNHYKELL